MKDKAELAELMAEIVDPEKYPATYKYYCLYGIGAAIPRYLLPPEYKTAEDLYAASLAAGKRWEDLVPLPPDDAII